jgi:hypothetical protein
MCINFISSVEAMVSRTITIRDMPPELERRVEAMASEEGMSLAQTVIRLLLRATGLREPDGPGEGHNRMERQHDLDDLAGTWDAEEVAEFERALAAQRRIDPRVWD